MQCLLRCTQLIQAEPQYYNRNKVRKSCNLIHGMVNRKSQLYESPHSLSLKSEDREKRTTVKLLDMMGSLWWVSVHINLLSNGGNGAQWPTLWNTKSFRTWIHKRNSSFKSTKEWRIPHNDACKRVKAVMKCPHTKLTDEVMDDLDMCGGAPVRGT